MHMAADGVHGFQSIVNTDSGVIVSNFRRSLAW
jgi:hypothetical protein